ncbi:MAG: alpha/beta fold hydrolase, partial [Acidimicrobiia bacterium]|nr:alpha/beta fold hydrolase [Acidimicrobiia bacterium]
MEHQLNTRRRLAVSIAALAAFTALITACSEPVVIGSSDDTVDGQESTDSSQTQDSSTTSTTNAVSSEEIVWSKCLGDPAGKSECGELAVPFDYDDPTIGSFTLFLTRLPATDLENKIGSMLVNPGGPGFGGSSVAQDAEYYFSSELLNRFDVIGWDPRGTGKSTPAVNCIDEYDEYFGIDSTPETPEEKQAIIDLSQKFNDECVKRSGEILPYISTQATARDMDSIRRALGEEKITYFGFSYGSELGATWATMFPNTVRA